MGVKQAVGIALLLVSLAILAYSFYAGAVKGMIGCEKLSAKLTIQLSNGTSVSCILPGPVACDKKAVDAFTAKVASMRGGKAPSNCPNGKVVGYKIVKTPVDTLEAGVVVAAWMGLIVGPWLAFGETPTIVGRRVKRGR